MFKNYLPLYEDEKINNYEEFNKILPLRELVPDKPGVPMIHQELIANFMNGATPINKLLLIHDLGTGKSCTAINSIEKNIRDGVYGMKRAIIINRGKAIMNNFINELVNKCTTDYNTVGNDKIKKSLWSKYYTFDTFELFSKKIKKLSNDNLIKQYNNTFFVIDEVHNIINDQSEVYTEISRFINVIPNLKVLLLSGTPVRDVPEDFIPIINLILPEEEHIEQKTFREKYYTKEGNLTFEFKKKLLNKVSYLKSSIPEIKVVESGNKILKLKKFNVVPHIMSDFQNLSYIEAYKKDFLSGGVYNNSRQASRFVFPDGTYGVDGFNTYVTRISVNKLNNNEDITKQYKFKSIMISELKKYGNDNNSILKRINEFSSKYCFIIKKIFEADNNKEKTLVYDDLVKGSGLIIFSLLLDVLGFTKYRLLTSETSNINNISKIQKKFNEDIYGDNISVLLGSKVIAEGFTFLDILHEHLVPHWNNTETLQVTARGIRMGSHNNTLKNNPNAFVTIYKHIALPLDKYTSIDYIMTKTSEEKEIEIDKIIEVIRETSLTCNEFKERNGGRCLMTKTRDNFILDNYISIGSLEIYKLNLLINFFKSNNYSHFSNIKKTLNFISNEELLKYLLKMIEDKIQIQNNKGVLCYLNKNKNFYFLIENINRETDVSMSFYTQDLKPYSNYKLYEDALNVEIVDFDSNKTTQRLLELATTVKLCNLKVSNIDKINELLKKYKDNWIVDFENNFAAVWFLSDIVEEKANIRCLKNPVTSQPWTEWTKCNKKLKKIISNKRYEETEKFETKLKNSSIQYYGLWNPILKEFCIKDISDTTKLEDKRQISSGKRCVNWKKQELINIAKNNLQMDRDWDEWGNKNRHDICKDIQQFLSINKLLIENKSCGVQTKKKI